MLRRDVRKRLAQALSLHGETTRAPIVAMASETARGMRYRSTTGIVYRVRLSAGGSPRRTRRGPCCRRPISDALSLDLERLWTWGTGLVAQLVGVPVARCLPSLHDDEARSQTSSISGRTWVLDMNRRLARILRRSSRMGHPLFGSYPRWVVQDEGMSATGGEWAPADRSLAIALGAGASTGLFRRLPGCPLRRLPRLTPLAPVRHARFGNVVEIIL